METISSQCEPRNNSALATPPEAPKRPLSVFKGKTSASLDNKETIFPRAIQRSQQRKARKWFLSNMVSESMKACATSFVATSDETTVVKSKTRGVRFTTLQTCKSVNCPRCAPHHQRALKEKIQAVYSHVLTNEEGKAALFTLTKGYYASATPSEQRKDLVKSMGRLVKGINKKFNTSIIYIIEPTFDFTKAKPSIHYHVHGLIGGNISEECRDEISAYILGFWLKEDRASKVRYISEKAQNLQWLKSLNGVSEYLAKAASFELAGASTKTAKNKNSTTWFQYLNDLEEEPSEAEKKMVYMFLSAEKGTRKYSSNKAFRETLNSLNLEEEDEENDETEVATFNVSSARELLRYDDGFLTADDIFSLLERNDEACKDFAFIASTCDNHYYDGYDAELARGLMLDGLTWLIDKYIYSNERKYWVDWRRYTGNATAKNDADECQSIN